MMTRGDHRSIAIFGVDEVWATCTCSPRAMFSQELKTLRRLGFRHVRLLLDQ